MEISLKPALIIGFGAAARGDIAPLLRHNHLEPIFCLTQRRWEEWNRQPEKPLGYTIHRVERDWKTMTREPQEGLTVIPCYRSPCLPSDQVLEYARKVNLILTAIGPSHLFDLEKTLAEIISVRAKAGIREPLNIILIENLSVTAEEVAVLKEKISRALEPECITYFEQQIGIVETVIETTVLAIENSLDVIADRLDRWLYVNSLRVKGRIPGVERKLEEEIEPVRMRKRFVHNFADTAVAYLGARFGHEFADEAAEDPRVFPVVNGAFREIKKALSREFPQRAEMSEESLTAYIERQMKRIRSQTLKDRMDRIARDPIRKLRLDDRFFGPARLAKKHNIRPVNLTECLKAALDDWLLE